MNIANKRSLRPDLTTEEWNELEQLNTQVQTLILSEKDRKRLCELEPFKVRRVHKDFAVLFRYMNLDDMAILPPVMIQSPTFRTEMSAYKVAAWLNQLERARNRLTYVKVKKEFDALELDRMAKHI
jgi:hypothetical protein